MRAAPTGEDRAPTCRDRPDEVFLRPQWSSSPAATRRVSQAPDHAMSADAAARRSVLLVEDDSGIAEGIRDLLEMEGYEVVWSQDGAEGLDVLRRLDPPPMLILLDLMMPRVDGYEFRDRQRADARLAAVPVLVLTADPTPPDRLFPFSRG